MKDTTMLSVYQNKLTGHYRVADHSPSNLSEWVYKYSFIHIIRK